MRLGATMTSERGKAVTKTGNDYLETLYSLTGRDSNNYRVRVIDDSKIGQIYFIVESQFFGKWREIVNEVIYTNVAKSIGSLKHGECDDCGENMTKHKNGVIHCPQCWGDIEPTAE